MRTASVFVVLCTSLAVAGAAAAQPIAIDDVPPELRPWARWVTEDQPTYGCTITGSGDQTVACLWPGRVTLNVTARSAAFALDVVADRRHLQQLPGTNGQWPTEARIDGRVVPVLTSPAGLPVVELTPGTHRIDGTIRYEQTPQSIALPATVARVELIAFGATVSRPRRQDDGSVWIDRAAAAEESETADHLELEVFRNIVDGVPLRLETIIVAHASGRTREVALGGLLPAGFLPAEVSGDLPMRLTRNGELTLLVHGGTFTVTIAALRANPNGALSPPRVPAPWPEEEIWVFTPDESLRQVELRGPRAIDPERTSLPAELRSRAAYVVALGSSVELAMLRRGEPTPPPDRIELAREVLLDLDGEGYTIRDTVSGRLNDQHRLDLIQGELGRATIAGQDQLITQTPGARGVRGVEVRASQLQMVAESRLPRAREDLPAVGWSADVANLRTTLHLPPGWELLGASGVDHAPGWIKKWDVGPLFFVLLVTAICFQLYGWLGGLLALLALLLTYHEPSAPRFSWLFLLTPIVLLRAVKTGLPARALYLAWAACALTWFVLVFTFGAAQLRFAVHPQLAEGDGTDVGRLGDDVPGFGAVTQEATAPSAPPPIAAPVEQRSREAALTVEEMLDSSGGLGGIGSGGSDNDSEWRNQRIASPYHTYANSAIVQTGPGMPRWAHRSFVLSWTGPVRKDHRVHLYLLPPWANRLLSVIRVGLLLGLLVLILMRRPAWPPPAVEKAKRTEPPSEGQSIAVAALALLVVGGTSAVSTARAQETPNTPSAAVLADLRARLTRAPLCSPSCTTIGSADVAVRGDTLTIAMNVSAGARAALSLPGPAAQWIPSTVTVDGRDAVGMMRADDGYLRLRLEPGTHRVVLGSSLNGIAELALGFPTKPQTITQTSDGWSVDGIDQNGILTSSLQLRRLLETTPSASGPGNERAAESSVDIPVWVQLERSLAIAVRWEMSTTLRRLTSSSAPIVVRVPLLPGEQISDANATVNGREAVISLGQGITEITWTSVIEPSANLVLEAPQQRAGSVLRSDVWQIACGPIWQCRMEGLPPTTREADGYWRPRYAPFPDDPPLRLSFVRPDAADGQATTIDSVNMTVTPGIRSTRTMLSLSVRSSVSMTLPIRLPANADIHTLTVNGAPRPMQRDNGVLRVGCAPGSTNIQIDFEEPRGISTVFDAPRIDFGREAVNVAIDFVVPGERWLLATHGPMWGPAILFWGYSVILLVAAFVFAFAPRSPLKLYEWVLLGIGLTQIPFVLALFVAGWFFISDLQHRRLVTPAWIYNIGQLGLVGYTLGAFSVLVGSVYAGLSVQPDMQVTGVGCSGDHLHWYTDRIHGRTPDIRVISVSVWWWKLLMLAWAIWLSTSVVRWAKWWVGPFRGGGFFMAMPKRPPVAPPIAQPRPAPQSPPGSPPAAPGSPPSAPTP